MSSDSSQLISETPTRWSPDRKWWRRDRTTEGHISGPDSWQENPTPTWQETDVFESVSKTLSCIFSITLFWLQLKTTKVWQRTWRSSSIYMRNTQGSATDMLLDAASFLDPDQSGIRRWRERIHQNQNCSRDPVTPREAGSVHRGASRTDQRRCRRTSCRGTNCRGMSWTSGSLFQKHKWSKSRTSCPLCLRRNWWSSSAHSHVMNPDPAIAL